MHGVPSECRAAAAVAVAAAADVVVSLQAGPGRLTGEERDTKCEVGASSPSYWLQSY